MTSRRVPIWVWTGDVETSSWTEKWTQGKGWTQRDLPPEVHQPSFLRGDESDAQLGFKFEWTHLTDIAHHYNTIS